MMPFRRLFGFAVSLLVGLVLLAGPVRAEVLDNRPLRIGLLPTNAPLSLLRLYDPLRSYLQSRLDRPVELYTAANFRRSYEDVKSGEFDLLVTAPHFGVVAVDLGYLPLVRYKAELRPLIVVPKGSSLNEGEQLRGKKVLTANRLTALSVVTETWLESRYGMRAGRDYQLVDASGHGTAIRTVGMGDADAAISSRSALAQVPEEIRNRVDSFEASIAVPHQFTLVHPRLGAQRIDALRAALAAFPDSEEGRRFFAASGFQGYAPLTPLDIEAARPYADKVVRMIENPS